MKRLAFVAAVIALVGCSKSDSAATDSSLPAMAPAPAAATDTGMKMNMTDSAMKADSAAKDSIAKGTKKP